MKKSNRVKILNPYLVSLFIGITFSLGSNAQQKCSEVTKTIASQKQEVKSEWLALEARLGSAKTLKEISNLEIGNFTTIKENLVRQKDFLEMTLQLAAKKKIPVGHLEVILKKIKKSLENESISYAHNWLVHFAMQEVADFHFNLVADGNAQLDVPSIKFITNRLSQSNFSLAEAVTDSANKSRIQRSFSLMHHYTDFQNPRFSESKKARLVGQERIPIPFFQRGFDISELNQLAIISRIRPVEIMSGVYETNQNGLLKFTAPFVDNRRMGVGKDASDHDFNHLGFEINAQVTRELGRIMFEGSEKLSPESLNVLNEIYFDAWHEWGSNLSSMETGTQWPMLLKAAQLRAVQSHGDPSAFKSVQATESTMEFLKKKSLPSFWQ